MALGRAAARALPETCFLVGRDTRRSGPLLQAALSAGMASEGADVVDVGVLPTPGVAWLSAQRGCPGRGGLGVAQPFLRQRRQALRGRGAQALRRHRARHRGASSTRVLDAAGVASRSPVGHGVGRLSDRARRAGPLHRASGAGARGARPHRRARRGRLRQRRRLGRRPRSPGAPRRRRARHRRGRPTAPTSTTGAAPPTPKPSPPRSSAAGRDVGLALDGDADRLLAVDHSGARGHRGRAAVDVRHRPGRAGQAGRQHRGGDGHDQPRVPPGHGRAGHHRARDPGRRPLRPRGAQRRAASPWAASSPGTSCSGTWPPPATACSPASCCST